MTAEQFLNKGQDHSDSFAAVTAKEGEWFIKSFGD